MRRKTYRYGSLIIGLLAALCIIVSHASQADQNVKSNPASLVEPLGDNGEPDDNEESKASISISATSFPVASGVGFMQQAICIFEIIFPHEESVTRTDQISLPLTKFFTTILSVFISPNAP
ncbi:MAG TPA: hypothetical protein VD884_17405 [Ohtaekwangia sp.]|nr:hypothetical protein [Ohtaekwangia sp.]